MKLIGACILLFSSLVRAAGPADGVKLYVLPKAPQIFNTDLQLTKPDGSHATVAKNWFSIDLAVDNQTPASDPDMASLSLYSVHVDVIITDPAGAVSLKSNDYYAGMDNFRTPTYTCSYSDFGQFDRGGSPLATVIANTGKAYPATGVNDEKLFGLPSDTSGACPISSPRFYVGGLPGDANSGYKYTVIVKTTGWFGGRVNLKQNYSGQVTFSLN
jgi:hypothetical protein